QPFSTLSLLSLSHTVSSFRQAISKRLDADCYTSLSLRKMDRRGSMGAAPPASDPPALQPTLRVMRLFKPRLSTRPGMSSSAQAAALLCPAEATPGMMRPLGGIGAGGPLVGGSDFALSGALKLPDSFGNIYQGETFTAYISVLNHLPGRTLGNVEVNVKLQSPNDRVDLLDRRMERGALSQPLNPAPELQTGENLDMIVEHRLKELGTHTLRVTVGYVDLSSPDGAEPKFLRKFYRFNVLNPINLNMTCIAVAGRPFVEVHLRNTTQMDLVLESCEFLPEEDYAAELIGGESMVAASPRRDISLCGRPRRLRFGVSSFSLVALLAFFPLGLACLRLVSFRLRPLDGRDVPSAVACFDARLLLRPDDSHQLVYRVRRLADTTAADSGKVNGNSDNGGLSSSNSPFDGSGSSGCSSGGGDGFVGSPRLGQVEVTWCTTMGEAGCVLSNPVMFNAAPRRGIDVTVEGLPAALALGRAAPCVAAVANRTERAMHLQLQFRTDAMSGVYVDGQSFFNLGEVAPGQMRRVQLRLLPLVAGLHELRGGVAVDMRTAQEYPQEKLCDVFVE
ncbi:unnamed protein product, partial [Phaeothamnion confervicola]